MHVYRFWELLFDVAKLASVSSFRKNTSPFRRNTTDTCFPDTVCQCHPVGALAFAPMRDFVSFSDFYI